MSRRRPFRCSCPLPSKTAPGARAPMFSFGARLTFSWLSSQKIIAGFLATSQQQLSVAGHPQSPEEIDLGCHDKALVDLGRPGREDMVPEERHLLLERTAPVPHRVEPVHLDMEVVSRAIPPPGSTGRTQTCRARAASRDAGAGRLRSRSPSPRAAPAQTCSHRSRRGA